MGAKVEFWNKDILLWAIDRSGQSLEVLLQKFPKLSEWLQGDKAPTLKQLEDLARKLYIPLAYLFLSEVPTETLPLTLFRQNTASQEVSVHLRDLISDTKDKQEWLSEYLQDLGEDPIPFVGSCCPSDSVANIVQTIREVLELPQSWAGAYDTWEDALRALIAKVEDAGIIVVATGIVGTSTRRTIAVEECRGFALVDDYAPFIYLNSSDSKSAQMFTLAHELAHIFLGESRGGDGYNMLPADDAIERLSDAIAAELLVPESLLREKWQCYHNDYKQLKRIFKVSPIVLARRAKDLGLITREAFFEFYEQEREAWRKYKQASKGGGNFYSVMSKRLSLRFAAYVQSAVRSNSLMYRDAYRLTHLKGKSYDQFMEQYHLA